jgi:hypothetical protein
MRFQVKSIADAFTVYDPYAAPELLSPTTWSPLDLSRDLIASSGRQRGFVKEFPLSATTFTALYEPMLPAGHDGLHRSKSFRAFIAARWASLQSMCEFASTGLAMRRLMESCAQHLSAVLAKGKRVGIPMGQFALPSYHYSYFWY